MRNFQFIFLLISTLTFASDSFQCDQGQINEAKKNHNPQDIMLSTKDIFQHFYQNTEAYNLPPYEVLKHGELKGFAARYNTLSKGKNSYVVNLAKAQSSQYYIKCNKQSNNSLCATPPSYIWGGMGWYEKKENDKKLLLNLHGNNEYTQKLSQHPGLDCSGFTYAVFSNAKLRVTTDLSKTPSFETADNTPARSYMNLDNNSCFKEIFPQNGAEKVLSIGDIIVWKQHMVIVDNVGNDPFGINHISSEKDCNIKSIKPQAATLTIVNSKGGFDPHSITTLKTYISNSYFNKAHAIAMNNKNLFSGIGMGISKLKISEYFYFSPNRIFPLALSWCKAKFAKQDSLPDIKIIRHKAFFANEDKPCQCFSREQDIIELKP